MVEVVGDFVLTHLVWMALGQSRIVACRLQRVDSHSR